MMRNLRLFFPLLICAVLITWQAVSSVYGREHFKIAIDIGHSFINPGAISAKGIPEYTFNKAVSELLLPELHRRNFKAAFILIPDGVDISLKKRTEIAGERKAEMLISIHHDSVQPKYLSSWIYQGRTYQYCDDFQGFSIFVSNRNHFYELSLQLAAHMGEQMLKQGIFPTMHHAENNDGENRPLLDKRRGIYEFTELGIVKSTPAPAVLIECGIILNRTEEELLEGPEYKRRIVFAISDAIELYFNEIKLQHEKIIDHGI